MFPIAANNTDGSNTSICVPNTSFNEPTKPYFAPYTKPQIIVETTAGTAYGKNVPIRKNFVPCNFIESKHRAIAAARNNMIGTCTTVNKATRPTLLQNCASPNKRT